MNTLLLITLLAKMMGLVYRCGKSAVVAKWDNYFLLVGPTKSHVKSVILNVFLFFLCFFIVTFLGFGVKSTLHIHNCQHILHQHLKHFH